MHLHPHYIKLGRIMLEHHTAEELMAAYALTEPDVQFIGYSAVQFGDINMDGTLN